MEIIELMIKDNYDVNEEYYAWETRDPDYLKFLKKIGELEDERA